MKPLTSVLKEIRDAAIEAMEQGSKMGSRWYIQKSKREEGTAQISISLPYEDAAQRSRYDTKLSCRVSKSPVATMSCTFTITLSNSSAEEAGESFIAEFEDRGGGPYGSSNIDGLPSSGDVLTWVYKYQIVNGDMAGFNLAAKGVDISMAFSVNEKDLSQWECSYSAADPADKVQKQAHRRKLNHDINLIFGAYAAAATKGLESIPKKP